MDTEKGFGRVQLDSGDILPFDVSVSVLGVPDVGAELVVTVGPSRLGGQKITRAEIVPRWETIVVPCFCLHPRVGDLVEMLYLHAGQGFRTMQPAPAEVQVGTTGWLNLECKRGASNFFATRATGWRVASLEAAHVEQLQQAFFAIVRDAWEAWEDVDGEHTASALQLLTRDVFAAVDLGLDVESMRTVTAWPVADEIDADDLPDVMPTMRLRR